MLSNFFLNASISTVGRPVLRENEFEYRTVENVAIYLKEGSSDKTLFEGFLLLTNLRFISYNRPDQQVSWIGWEIPLKLIQSHADCAGFLRSSKRIHLKLNVETKVFDIHLRFNGGGKESVLEYLPKALSTKSWEPKPISNKTPNNTSSSTLSTTGSKPLPNTSHTSNTVSINNKETTLPNPPNNRVANVGISGILERQKQQMKQADTLANSALSDLDSLAQKAKEVVNVIQRYAAYLQEMKTAAEEEGFSETSSQLGEVNEMETIMQNIGVISPVTRLSAGRLYHQQLARQLAELLYHQHRLQRLGGMITLTDAYCLYNRARGTELVSPDDLFHAVEMMSLLRLGMQLRTFPSGVKVIQLDSSLDDQEFQSNVLIYLESDEEYLNQGASPTMIAKHLNISLLLVREQLLEAERKGILCRDESLEGLMYFPNRFRQLVP
jgi:ESCRT-II complex subunit VPS36